MRTLKYSELIGWSIQRIRNVLFRPFDLKKWFWLLVIAALAGVLASGNDAGGIQQGVEKYRSEQAVEVSSPEPPPPSAKQRLRDFSRSPQALILIPLLCFWILCLWISSRFQFIWIRAAVKDDVQIWPAFMEYSKIGNSYFMFMLFLFAIGILAVGWFAYGVLSTGGSNGEMVQELRKFSTPILVIFIPLGMLGSFLMNCVTAFALPLMFRDQTGLKEAWAKFWRLFISDPIEILGFSLVNLFLIAGCAVAELVAGAAMFFLIGLAGLLTLGPCYLLFMVLLKVPFLLTVCVFLLGIPLLFLGIFVMLSVRLPFGLFLRIFSLAYLSSHGPEYKVIE